MRYRELMGDALLIVFGIILIYIFITIEILGYYGVEHNTLIRWIELVMGVPLIILGIERLIDDIRRK